MATRRQDGSLEVLKYILHWLTDCFICWKGILKSQTSTCKRHLDMICRAWILSVLSSQLHSLKQTGSQHIPYSLPTMPAVMQLGLHLVSFKLDVEHCLLSFVDVCCASMRSRFGGVALRKVTRAGWLVLKLHRGPISSCFQWIKMLTHKGCAW